MDELTETTGLSIRPNPKAVGGTMRKLTELQKKNIYETAHGILEGLSSPELKVSRKETKKQMETTFKETKSYTKNGDPKLAQDALEPYWTTRIVLYALGEKDAQVIGLINQLGLTEAVDQVRRQK